MQKYGRIYAGLLLGALAGLSACGGGDDAPAAAAPVALSAQNEATLSSVVVQQVDLMQGVSSVAGGANQGDSTIARASVKRVMKTVLQAARVGALATSSTTFDCESGSITLEVADDLSIFNLTFANCVDGGVTNTGAMNLSRVSISADGLQQVYDAKLALATAEGTTIDKTQGDFRISFDRKTAGQSIVTLSSTVLSLEHSVNGQAQIAVNLRGLQLSSVVSDSGDRLDSFSFNSDGTLSLLGNAVYKVETVTALSLPSGAVDPVSGQIKITVAGKGIILLTAEATRVHVQADVEGDGKFEVDRFQTWSSLASAAP